MLYFTRWQKFVLLILSVALLAGLGVLLYGRGRQAALASDEAFFKDSPARAGNAGRATAQIAGAVAKPGLYALPNGTRISDLIAKAGGATKQADLSAVNLAAVVQDGEKIEVPEKQTEQSGGEADGARPTTALASSRRGPAGASQGPKQLPKKPVSLNTATAKDFEQLPGIGPVLAERIIEYRKKLKAENGRGFAAKEQLMEVPGIGPKKYANLMDYVKL